MPTTVTDRISGAKAYLEPDLYYIVMEEAKKEDITVSNWMRKLIIKELLERKVLPQEIIMKIAVG